MTAPAASPRLSRSVIAVRKLAPHIGSGRVRIRLNVGTLAYPVIEALTGEVLCLAARVTGLGRDIVDVVVREDDSPLPTTFAVTRLVSVEPIEST